MLGTPRYIETGAKRWGNGYVSLHRIAEKNLQTGWADKVLIGREYRQLSDTVTRRGHWRRKLKYISHAIDSLGDANGRELSHLKAVRDSLTEYGNRGYLKRSMREGSTRENDFTAAMEKLDNYISGQGLRLERRKQVRRSAAAAVFSVAVLFSRGPGKSYNPEIEALRVLNSRPAIASACQQEDTGMDEAAMMFAETLDNFIPDTPGADGPVMLPEPTEHAMADHPEPENPAEKSHQAPEPVGRGDLPVAGNMDIAYVIALESHIPIEPREPLERELISWKNMPQDAFREMKTRPLPEGYINGELLMAGAAEAHALNQDGTAYRLCQMARSAGPGVNTHVADTNYDGIVDGNDPCLCGAVKRDIAISNFYLQGAMEKLANGNTAGAWGDTYPALMYNGEAGDSVRVIRGRADPATAIWGDVSGYGDWLLFDGEVRYGGERIKPFDAGVYPTDLKGSIGYTGKKAGKTLGDAGTVLHKTLNTAVGTSDRVVSTGINLIGATFGKIFNPKADHDAAFARNMARVNERTASGYGSGKTYIGQPAGKVLGDVWQVGNGAVNTVGGAAMTAYNGTVRPVLEGGGALVGGESGFKKMHEAAGLGQIPIAAVTDTVLVFGNDEPKKAQSEVLMELSEDMGLVLPTLQDTVDRNRDDRIDAGEFLGSLPGVQGIANPQDSYSTMTQRFWRWASNLGQAWLMSADEDHGAVGKCSEPEREGGGPSNGGDRGGGGPAR